MSDEIKRAEAVIRAVRDSSLPKAERLQHALHVMVQADLPGLNEFVEDFEADLARSNNTIDQMNEVLNRAGETLDPEVVTECEQHMATLENQREHMLDMIDSAASRFLETAMALIVAKLEAGVDHLPEDAIREAREHRELMVPRLIQALKEAITAARQGNTPQGNAHFFALFLLTEFEAHEAFPVILDSLTLPRDLSYDLFGDAFTCSLQSILALFAGEHPETIDGLIADRALDLYVRWAAAETYKYLVRDGRMGRDEAVRRLQQHLRRAIEDDDQELAAGLVCELANFAPREAIDDIREAYDRGEIDESIIGLDGVERAIAEGEARLRHVFECLPSTGIPDTIEELGEWAAFQQKREQSTAPRREPVFAPALPKSSYGSATEERVTQTIVSENPRIGRNEPCPCGSGKKFKKCCGGRN
ncbi:MAG TPA: DUF1186 domain-containing protein [Pirellulales bacterium]|nr:DUF1186 domain-containing protein [Pirellulales bacterium]